MIKKEKYQKEFPDCSWIEDFHFDSGATAPIYDIQSVQGLNRVIGYFKMIYSDCENVYYRGQVALYKTVSPSGFRNNSIRSYNNINRKLNHLLEKCEKELSSNLHLQDKNTYGKLIIESVLQHYGTDTRCIDVVDNHWIALWFGLYKFDKIKRKSGIYARYLKRTSDLRDTDQASCYEKEYQYILLIAADKQDDKKSNVSGITYGRDLITIDLRRCIPSQYLRPHAQHGLIVKKNLHTMDESYDISNNVVAILRLNINMVDDWLGTGELLSVKNLFPPAIYDEGYDVLLHSILGTTESGKDDYCSIYRYIY
jgi:hypothetical protein